MGKWPLLRLFSGQKAIAAGGKAARSPGSEAVCQKRADVVLSVAIQPGMSAPLVPPAILSFLQVPKPPPSHPVTLPLLPPPACPGAPPPFPCVAYSAPGGSSQGRGRKPGSQARCGFLAPTLSGNSRLLQGTSKARGRRQLLRHRPSPLLRNAARAAPCLPPPHPASLLTKSALLLKVCRKSRGGNPPPLWSTTLFPS